MDAVRTHLVRRGPQLVLLLTPPFDQAAPDPGYVRGYPPGVRENGGQYTHAAAWVVAALARLGSGDEAAEFFHMLNPVNRSRTAAEAERYGAEPYVLAGDVYAHPQHVGRGGWTWYTGSAGWMLRVAIESVFGMTRQGGDSLRIRPCTPAEWGRYQVRYRVPETGAVFSIVVRCPAGDPDCVTEAWMDGQPLAIQQGGAVVPIRGVSGPHAVEIVLGPAAPGPAPETR